MADTVAPSSPRTMTVLPHLPSEIWLRILALATEINGSLVPLATVCRSWQAVVERRNFSRIRLTPARLAKFRELSKETRSYVRYVWFCVELSEYSCDMCATEDSEREDMANTSARDKALIEAGLIDLIQTLSICDPDANMTIDLSFYSISDSKHGFKYPTFVADYCGEDPTWALRARQGIDAKPDDLQHGWYRGLQMMIPPERAVCQIFGDIMEHGPPPSPPDESEEVEEEVTWLDRLPLVQAVKCIFLRRQNRRYMSPDTLRALFSLFPRLEEIHYEPWADCGPYLQGWTDDENNLLLESLGLKQLRKLIIFESFDDEYAHRIGSITERALCPDTSEEMCRASFTLEELSGSFLVDARFFFAACRPTMRWPNLASVALTSRLLTPFQNEDDINAMLLAAANAAKRMPKLKNLEIWNADKWLAAVFRYQLAGSSRCPAVVTWRSTWEFRPSSAVLSAWEKLAIKNGATGFQFVAEKVDAPATLSGTGRIHLLQLQQEVIRPISHQQARMEQAVRCGFDFE